MATVALEGLTRRHAGTERAALDRLDLEVEDGELLVLVGPSGCGKSTALRLLAGLDAPDGGRVRIDGRDVTSAAPQDRDVAMVFQGYALYPHMSARENIAFPLKMRGIEKAERARRVGEVADMLGLGKLLERRPGELSGGERQRVAMGRAIVRRPKVFLFDEPLANLDAALRAELRVELASLVRRLGTTSIYVTHDQAEAMTMGDRIGVMKDGRLQQVASPRAVYETPANLFVAAFLGAPPMNLVEVELRGGAYEGGGLAVTAPPGALPERVTIGLRPEHLVVGAHDRRSAGVYRAPHLALRAEVVGREPLGAETNLRLAAGGAIYWARAPGFDAPSLGEIVDAHVDPTRLLWFDRRTGERVQATAPSDVTSQESRT
jgi:multiple sugar transport system ATP-binding protein